MRPPASGASSASFQLNKKFARFRSIAAVRDHHLIAGLVDLTFTVLGDGKILWQNKNIGKGKCASVEVALNNVGLLELRVECPDVNERAYAVWVDPVLSRAGPPNDVIRLD